MAANRLTVLLIALVALLALLAGVATALPTDGIRVSKRSSCAECVEGERCEATAGGMVSCVYQADQELHRRAPV